MSRFRQDTQWSVSQRAKSVHLQCKVDLRNVFWGKRSKQSDAKLCLTLRRKKIG